MFGTSEADFIAHFGQPISRNEKKFDQPGSDGYRWLTGNVTVDFGDVEAMFVVFEGGSDLAVITYKGGPCSIWGLRVGSPVSDVEALLGAPDEKGDGVLTYYSNTWTICIATFTVRNGRVVEIRCKTESQG
jgi:hypothetical protein